MEKHNTTDCLGIFQMMLTTRQELRNDMRVFKDLLDVNFFIFG